MITIWQDLRYGARTLLRTPGFTLIAVLTLALGIGANTAIFSVVNAALIRALPYHNPNRLVMLFAKSPDGQRDTMSIQEMREFQAQSQSIEDLSGFITQSVNLTGGDRPDRVRGAFVTANYFQVFGLEPIVGRMFAPGEDGPGAEKVVVISEKIWRERLGGQGLTGKKLILNGEPFNVIGVAPPGFRQPLDPEVEVWMGAATFPGYTARRDFRHLVGIGHLKPGAALAQAQAEMNAVANQFALAYPEENAGRGAGMEYFHDVMTGSLRRMLYLLFATVGVILLIACANLANLLLARGMARRREIALRAALGAGKWRLIRQLLTEASLLGLAGGGLGLLLAQWGLTALQRLPQNFVRDQGISVDSRVLLFTLAVAILTGWLFGLTPAIQLTRPELNTMLKEGGRGGGEGAKWSRLSGAFVVAQVAMSLLLLVGGGLLIRSFDKLLRVNPGFKPENLLTLEYRLPRNKYQQSEAQWNFHRQVVERIRDVPGVKSASLVRGLPFSGNGGDTEVILPDRETPPKGKEPRALINTATPTYFETIGIPLIKGRLFSESDRSDTPRVFLINQTMARRFWPDQDPIGKQIKAGTVDGVTGVVIGVVGDAKHYLLDEEARSQMYETYSQSPGIFATIVIRTTVEPMGLAEAVRQAVWTVDSDQPMWKVRTVESLIDRSVADRRFLMVLMGVFAALALALTVIGLYGVMSYAVSQRTQEIGVRMALGAGVRNIHRMVMLQGMTLVSIGVGVGLAASWLLTRLIANQLFGVSATDPLTFGAISLALIIVALLACLIPARRATKVDPIIALRRE